MEVLTWLGVLLGIAAVGGACWGVRDYAWRHYRFSIFNKGTLAYMIVPLGLFLISLQFVLPGETYWSTIMAGDLNMILMVALIAISLIGFTWYLASQTNIWVALFSTMVLIVAAVIAAIILILLSSQKKKD